MLRGGEMLEAGDTASDSRRITPPADARTSAHLALVFEADRPLAGGMRVDLEGLDEVLLCRGTTRSCERRDENGRASLFVSAPDSTMSARHARITREGARWVVRDLRSTNGVSVNGRAAVAQPLNAGDVLQVGHTFFLFMGDVLSPACTPALEEAASSTTSHGVATLMPSFARELNALERLASARLSVLILGETGTGKELLARSIHATSQRSGPLVAVNCAAIPGTLVESQLFGHCRGAFSGAVRDEPGFVRSADGGTLFLDEIGDLSRSAQGALLRVLQEGEVVPVGATRAIRVDVRVVAATHRDLAAMAAAGMFRADLLARLDGATVRVPPLRDRRADLGALVATLLPRVAGDRAEKLKFQSQAALAMLMHAWPSNVRGLEHCLARASAIASDVIYLEHLPPAVAGTLDRPTPPEATAQASAPVRDVLVAQLRSHRGNVAAVARTLGKAPVQIQRWMRRFGIDPNEFRNLIDIPER